MNGSAEPVLCQAMRHLVSAGLLLPLILLSACAKPEPLACTAPRSYWSLPEQIGADATYNTLTLDRAGKAYWNHSAVTDAVLDQMLKASGQVRPVRTLLLQTEMGLSCARLDTIRDRIDTELDCRRNAHACTEGHATSVPLPPGHSAERVP